MTSFAKLSGSVAGIAPRSQATRSSDARGCAASPRLKPDSSAKLARVFASQCAPNTSALHPWRAVSRWMRCCQILVAMVGTPALPLAWAAPKKNDAELLARRPHEGFASVSRKGALAQTLRHPGQQAGCGKRQQAARSPKASPSAFKAPWPALDACAPLAVAAFGAQALRLDISWICLPPMPRR